MSRRPLKPETVKYPARYPTRAWFGLLILATALLVATSAVGQGDQRWSEVGYGISLTPPPNTVQVEGEAVSWLDPRGFAVSFEIVSSDVPVELKDMTITALVQMGFAQATPRMLDRDGQPANQEPVPERLGDRPAIRMYFDLDQQDKPDWFYEMSNLDREAQPSWFYGQAIVMLEPHAAAVIKLTSARDLRPISQAAFDAVLDSLEIPLAEELDAMREERVERADAWLSTVAPPDWAEALPRDQWYRLIQYDRDIGHVRVRSSRETADLRRFEYEPPGTLLVIEKREYLGDQAIDSISRLYAHDDTRQEVWETRTTLRPGVSREAPQGGLTNRHRDYRPTTWVETGLRGNQQVQRTDANGNPIARTANVVTVINEAPPASAAVRQIEAHERFTGRTTNRDVRGRVNVNEWVAPDRAYLAQLQTWALGAMLPTEPAVYCFSAYHPDTGQPGLRTVEVQPQADGGLIVLDRPTSKHSPTRSVYDAERRMVERVSPNGVRLVPTTPQELAEVWGVKLD